MPRCAAKKKKVNYPYWKKLDLWTLRQAACLIFNIEPTDNSYFNHGYRNNILKKVNETIKMAKESIFSGKLEPDAIAPEEDVLEELSFIDKYKFFPENILVWAAQKELNIPIQLKDLIPIEVPYTSEKGEVPPFLNKKHPEFSYPLYIAIEIWMDFLASGKIKPELNRISQIKDYFELRYKKEIASGILSNEMIERIATVINGGKKSTPSKS